MDSDFDLAVVGAGVIGLAVAERASRDGRSVLVVDRTDRFGSETSSRNSEVVHAGHYYPPGSLKALTCNAGRRLLYEFCAQYGVEHRRCGKLIVADGPDDEAVLEVIRANSRASGGGTLELIDGDDAKRLEPALRVTRALWSPDTGIVDSHGFMTALAALAENRGAQLVMRCSIGGLEQRPTGWALRLADEQGQVVTAREVVLAAGLGSAELARSIEGYPADRLPKFHYAKGNYYGYSGRVPFSRLIYPVPVPGGLGTHLTLDLAGRGRFGPDVEWIERPDYAIGTDRRAAVAAAVRRFWPAVEEGRLFPDYAGVRPKISGPGEAPADFCVAGPRQHGLPGLVAAFGIESPGLTASLALADHALAALSGGP